MPSPSCRGRVSTSPYTQHSPNWAPLQLSCPLHRGQPQLPWHSSQKPSPSGPQPTQLQVLSAAPPRSPSIPPRLAPRCWQLPPPRRVLGSWLAPLLLIPAGNPLEASQQFRTKPSSLPTHTIFSYHVHSSFPRFSVTVPLPRTPVLQAPVPWTSCILLPALCTAVTWNWSTPPWPSPGRLRSSSQCYPIGFSVTVEMSSLCTVQYGSHLKCGQCYRGAAFSFYLL